MIRRLFIAGCLFLGFATAIDAQSSNLPNVMLPSPTAMQFQRYGDYPVNTYTGVPGISIPLFTIKEGDISLPIKLNYHASGCRVNDVSGFVGLGWSLDVGGMLTRTIQNLPDEERSFIVPSKLQMDISLSNPNYLDTLDKMEENYWEHEYDIWSYNFLGRSGKYIESPYRAQKFEFQKSNLLFTYDGSSGNKQIIDENGIMYEFSVGGTELTEYEDPITFATKEAPTMWPLESIHSTKDKDNKIIISHVAGAMYERNLNTNSYVVDDWGTAIEDYSDPMYYSLGNYGGIQYNYYKMRQQTMVPYYISFRSGAIYFVQDAARKQLDTIKIYNSDSRLIRSIVFNIIPFDTSYHGNNLFKNYKLESIEFRDSLGSLTERYAFNYNSETNPTAKPDAYDQSAGTDHWGFYNGDDGRATRIPSYSGFLYQPPMGGGLSHYTTIGGGAIKTPSETHTKTYVLNKITYPTGGWTVFDLEINKLGNDGPTTIGGLRVKKISNYTAAGEIASYRDYTYLGGVAEMAPDAGHYLNASAVDGGIGLTTFRRTRISEIPLVNLSPRGSPIVYDAVIESDGRLTTTTYFDNDPAYSYEEMNYPNSGYSGGPSNYYFKKIANNYKPWNFGNPLTTIVATQIGTNKVENEYEEFVVDTLRDFLITRWVAPECLINQSPSYNCSMPSSYDYGYFSNFTPFNFNDRFYYSGGKRLKQATETISREGIIEMVKVTKYFYENPAYPTIVTRTLTTDSKGDSISTKSKFPFDFVGTAVYDEMITRNIIAPALEIETKNETRNKILNKIKTNYTFWLGDMLVLPSSIQKSVLGNSLTTELTFNSYDSSGNLLQATGREGVVTSYIWGYNRRFPVAKVSGKTYSDAISQSGLDINVVKSPSSESAMRTELNKLRSLTNAFTQSMTANPLIGVTSETDVRGRTLYYQYDAAGRLSVIKDNDSKILKIFRYSIYDRTTDDAKSPIWANTGSTYCEKCKLDTNYATGRLVVQQRDTNSQSYTYNQTRWITTPSMGSCVSASPDWANTGNYRCVLTPVGQNNGTGAQEREEISMNPCVQYNTKRWVSNGTNFTACPAPSLYNCADNSGYYIKNDCSDIEKGDTVWVPIPVGSVTSPISYDDANFQAAVYGQNYANTNGGCSPDTIMLELNMLIGGSSRMYDIMLTDHNNSSIGFTFLSSNYGYGINELGRIPAGYYDIVITPVTSASTINFEAGCGNYDTGVSATFTNVKLYRDCRVITAAD